MLDAVAVTKQLAETRRLLGDWAEVIAAGTVPAGLPQHVRELNDLLTCLLDEAPRRQHVELNYLINRCESIAARLAN